MRTFTLIASLAIIYATAANPIVDSVVPEDIEEPDMGLDEARQTIHEMTAAGKSDKDCRKLVTETKNDVTTNVHNCQKVIDALPNGGACPNRGQDAVRKSTNEKNKADKHVTHCHNEVTKAASASVDFGSRTFSSLTEGRCASFYSSSTFTSAEAKYNAAVTAHTKAKGAASEAATALKNAVEAAAKAKHECLCKTGADANKAYNDCAASNAANKKAWDFAHKVECVLDGKATCKGYAGCPVPRRLAVTGAVKEERCTKK